MIAAKLLTFLWKDWLQVRSYRLAFIMENVGLLVPLAGLFFMSRMFGSVEIPSINRYGGNYITFALLGIIIVTYSFTGLRAFSTTLRAAQVSGTLEMLLLTRANLPTILAGWSLYPFLRATVQMLIYLVAGFLILGLQIDQVNLAATLLILVLTVVIMCGLGILAAAFTLVFKQGDPFTGLMSMAAGMLSGTLYPISVLPGWLEAAAKVLPQTYLIEAMRLAVLDGASIADLAPQLGPLLVFVAALPGSLIVFDYAMHRARVEGSLGQF